MTFDNNDGKLFEIAKDTLLPHSRRGHKIEIVSYGDDESITIECTSCGAVLVDFTSDTGN